MSLLSRIIATDYRLLEPICTFTQYEGYVLYRSEMFRNFYGGNGIGIRSAGDRDLAAWEAIFDEHFERPSFVHTTFTFPMEPEFERLIREGEAAGYFVDRDAFMVVDHRRDARPMPQGFEVRSIRSEEEWERLKRFSQSLYIEGAWYDPEKDDDDEKPDRLFEKTRFVSETIGIEWFTLHEKGAEEILGKLGVVLHNGLARLQDVEVGIPHRRRGVATALVSHAIRHALDTLGAEALALAADTDYHAIDLYRTLGFRECGYTVEMMKYPIRNPKFA